MVFRRVTRLWDTDDVMKLQNVVDGMSIVGKMSKSQCEVCTEGKFTQTRNRKSDVRAKSALQLVHTDLAGPIDPQSKVEYIEMCFHLLMSIQVLFLYTV